MRVTEEIDVLLWPPLYVKPDLPFNKGTSLTQDSPIESRLSSFVSLLVKYDMIRGPTLVSACCRREVSEVFFFFFS